MNLPHGFRWAAAVVLGVSLFANQLTFADEKPARKTKRAWTLAEARDELLLYPRDPYLQYVALQLARRENKQDETAKMIAELLGGEPLDPRGRTGRADLFSIFTGALAVQESLQLDTMRNPENPGAVPRTPLLTRKQIPATIVEKKVPYTVAKNVPEEVEKNGVKTTVFRTVYETHTKDVTRKAFPAITVLKAPAACASAVGSMVSTPWSILTPTTLAGLTPDIRRPKVDLAALKGPEIKSHPWKKMLAGRKPEISPLARCVPDDFYFVQFRSLNKLMEVLERSDLWSTHLYNQAVREARTQRVGERLREQLAIRTDDVPRAFYDRAVAEVAVTGSDLYLRESSDVTLIFALKQPKLFKARMDAALKEAEKKYPGARTSKGECLGVPYVHLETPERELHVFSAYPRPDLHVRGNSLSALQRVLEAIQGKDAEGKKVRRLGDTPEFAYVRTLMPEGAKEEDGLIYLSDPFIRRQVGPRVKLTERRRLLCYNHLRMIGHASMMYRTEFGQAPHSLTDLIETRCIPAQFGKTPLACPDGGKYSLSADGNLGVCSRHGHAHFLRPCRENALATVSAEEADAYAAFRKDYNQYWRTYFDPIAIRIQVSEQRYRLETLVLPLIDNSIYTRLASMLGGPPEPLDALPLPKENIFSVNFRLNKKALHKELKTFLGDADEKQIEKLMASEKLTRELKKLGVPDKQARKLTYKNIQKVFYEGLGNQIGFHVYDAEPHLDFNLPKFLGDMIRLLNDQDDYEALIGFGLFLLSSANSPAYLSLPRSAARQCARRV